MAAAQQPEVGTAVALPAQITKQSFRADVEPWRGELEKVAYRGFTAERVLTAALSAALDNPKIFEADPKSLYLALMRTARWGLDIGDGVALVPLNKKISKRGQSDKWLTVVEAWPDYKGLKALAIRQGLVRNMEEYAVYHGDTFEYQLGMEAFLRHQPIAAIGRGPMTGAYSIIRLPHGEKTFNFMPIEDIEAIRAKSKSWGPDVFKTCPVWYAKKTVVRDYLNRQPKSGAMREALEADDVFDPETGEVFERPRIQAPAQQEDEDLATDRELADE